MAKKVKPVKKQTNFERLRDAGLLLGVVNRSDVKSITEDEKKLINNLLSDQEVNMLIRLRKNRALARERRIVACVPL